MKDCPTFNKKLMRMADNKKKPRLLSIHPSQKPYNRSSITSSIKLFSLFLPLFLGFFTYRYVNSGPFLPISCQFFGLGCPSAKDTLRGFIDPRFESVKEIFIRNIESGDEVGASVTVYYDNKVVVDLQGGIADSRTGKVYDKDTLQLVFSSTKVLTSIVVARLVEQGLLDYDEKIATYWPAFAQGGKENVTLSDLMQHSAGVGWLDSMGHSIRIKDLYDLDHFAKILERQSHNFNGKRTRAYHGVTRGYYLNEIVRRVDPKRRTVGKIVADEILPAYDIEFYYSTTSELLPRVANIYTYPILRVLAKFLLPKWMISEPLHSIFNSMFDSKTAAYKTLVYTSPDQSQPNDWNRIEMLIPEGPSYNGVTNSRSMAKLAAIMANGGQPIDPNIKEPQLLSKSTYDLLTKKATTEYDLVLHETLTMSNGGLGYFKLGDIDMEFTGWGGSGGSLLLWNEEYKLGFAYCMNAFQTSLLGDRRGLNMLSSVVDIIKELKNQRVRL